MLKTPGALGALLSAGGPPEAFVTDLGETYFVFPGGIMMCLSPSHPGWDLVDLATNALLHRIDVLPTGLFKEAA